MTRIILRKHVGLKIIRAVLDHAKKIPRSQGDDMNTIHEVSVICAILESEARLRCDKSVGTESWRETWSVLIYRSATWSVIWGTPRWLLDLPIKASSDTESDYQVQMFWSLNLNVPPASVHNSKNRSIRRALALAFWLRMRESELASWAASICTWMQVQCCDAEVTDRDRNRHFHWVRSRDCA